MRGGDEDGDGIGKDGGRGGGGGGGVVVKFGTFEREGEGVPKLNKCEQEGRGDLNIGPCVIM